MKRRDGQINRVVAYIIVFLCLSAAVAARGSSGLNKTDHSRGLPSVETLVANYWKAIGGKRRLAAIKDASFSWTIELQTQKLGVAKTVTKAPGSARSELTFGNGQLVSAATSRSVWELGLNGELRTLTGPEASTLKLMALLGASYLIDYKKDNVAARVISFQTPSQQEIQVEFSTRGGARTIYSFDRNTSLITTVEDGLRHTKILLFDYRPEGGLLQPHRVEVDLTGTGRLSLVLQQVNYNSGVSNSFFDPPAGSESLDIAALLREVVKNQDEVEKHFTEYSVLQEETDREISSRGEIKKEQTKVFEVFPIAHRQPILKLISENGVPLSPARAAKEEQRVQEEFLKAERDRDKDEKREQHRRDEQRRKRAAKGNNSEDELQISQFLKVCEFVSPRRERFRDRDAIVFDFRARAGFKPGNRQEDLISKLVGIVWIDPFDKQLMRLEAKLAEGFKMAGGLLLSVRPGAALVVEQIRIDEGIWLPLLAQINLSVKVLLFGGGDVNKSIEWSNYRHFSGTVNDYKLNAPKEALSPNKKL